MGCRILDKYRMTTFMNSPLSLVIELRPPTYLMILIFIELLQSYSLPTEATNTKYHGKFEIEPPGRSETN